MKLLALKCPVCGQRLTPKNKQALAMSCANCETAVSIDPDKGIQETTLHFASPKSTEVSSWLPMWVFDAKVNITSRRTRGRDGRSEKASKAFWGVPRRLYVPAWTPNMQSARMLGTKLVENQPQFQLTEKPSGAQISEMVVAEEDALKLVEFIIMSLEAERKDWLTNLQFDIQKQAANLWAIPAQKKQQGWNLLI